MSLASAAVASQLTLADAIDEALTDALDGGSVACLWCGAAATVAVADRFTGRVVLRCAACGSELEGTRARRRGEVRA